jgi:hypothetical protein
MKLTQALKVPRVSPEMQAIPYYTTPLFIVSSPRDRRISLTNIAVAVRTPFDYDYDDGHFPFPFYF